MVYANGCLTSFTAALQDRDYPIKVFKKLQSLPDCRVVTAFWYTDYLYQVINEENYPLDINLKVGGPFEKI